MVQEEYVIFSLTVKDGI